MDAPTDSPPLRTDRLAGNVLRGPRGLPDAIFAPRTVAVIGATETAGSVGRTILWNLIRNPFGGTVYPVNPKRPSVLGIKAYPNVSSVPDQIDLAVVVTPAATVPEIIGQCVEARVRGAIIISAGFKEIGPTGAALEADILARARSAGMRIIGPNCLGVMNPLTGLNATFASAMARPGNVGFISQSGALCTAVLDWSLQENVGFSAFISVGSMLDVGWGDLISYLGEDTRTKSIVLYMESIGDARAFLSAAREVAMTKPIIAIKAGRTEAAAKAAASHTGSLTGSDEVLDAAFRRCGVLRVRRISELFHMASVLSKQPRPRGPRLTILTNAGGPGVLATDALISAGGKLAPVSSETRSALDALLPPHWSHANPIDILGDADAERYAKAFEIAANDPENDGLLVILTPQDMSDPTGTAERVKAVPVPGKPVLASWMGAAEVAAGEAILNRADIPTFPFPDTAAQIFTNMWRYSENLRGLYETPSLDDAPPPADGESPGDLLRKVAATGRTLLTEAESKALLLAAGIPTVPTLVATSPVDAVGAARRIGYPVVLKLHSETITHKTDVGGVVLNLGDDAAVADAFHRIESSVADRVGSRHFLGVTVQPMVRLEGYELIVGSSVDPQFGPVILFGSGGQLVEIYGDHSLGLPPLNTTLARRMMERTKIYTALQGVRGRRPVDLAALERLLVRFSRLIAENPRIMELDINPLVAGPDGVTGLDARVVLHPAELDDADLPRPAIRPYPIHLVGTWTARDGRALQIRPIRPEDEPLMIAFHERLSENSVYLRYFQSIKLSRRIAHERLVRICFIDYDREIALVADGGKADGTREILAVGRLSKLRDGETAEFGMLVRDDAQGIGLGTELLRRLVAIGREERLKSIGADILTQNLPMQRVCGSVGFRFDRLTEDPAVVRAELELG